MMKSPESLVTKHVLQGVPEVGAFVRFSHFATNATWSILGAARLFFVKVLFDHSLTHSTNQSFNQSINRSLHLRVNVNQPKVKPSTKQSEENIGRHDDKT